METQRAMLDEMLECGFSPDERMVGLVTPHVPQQEFGTLAEVLPCF